MSALNRSLAPRSSPTAPKITLHIDELRTSEREGSECPQASESKPQKVPKVVLSKKLEYNRTYVAKRRARAAIQLKDIKKYLLETPDQLDVLKQISELKKRINETK